MKVHHLIAGLLATAASVLASSLQQVTNFGDNPTNLQMHIYVPDKLASKPAIIVGLHPCGGSGQGWFSQSLARAADSGGFILIYPSTTRHSNCWDVNNAGSLTHGGTGDATGIISSVKYALSRYSADASRVFVMGGSSGGMMTSVMIGAYPDVFAAGATYSGVAFACFAGSLSDPTPYGSNQSCAQGLQHSPDDWARFVKNAYPAYSGRRPRVLVAHGLADNLVHPQCAYEQLKQWSAVMGLKNTKNVTGSACPEGSQYTQLVYGDGTQLVGYLGLGVGHIAPPVEPVMLKFFGLA